nr:MAG TPA: hypothetical protein [Caudoviricetes sp.]
MKSRLQALSPVEFFKASARENDFRWPVFHGLNEEVENRGFISRTDCQVQEVGIREPLADFLNSKVFLRVFFFECVKNAVCSKAVEFRGKCSGGECELNRIKLSGRLHTWSSDRTGDRSSARRQKKSKNASDQFRYVLEKLINQAFHGLLLRLSNFCFATLFSHSSGKATHKFRYVNSLSS